MIKNITVDEALENVRAASIQESKVWATLDTLAAEVRRLHKNAAAPEVEPNLPQHYDDTAVDKFAEAMKLKLAEKREEGYSGWETCSVELLRKELIKHIAYGDPVDVANFAMMLFSREEETL